MRELSEETAAIIANNWHRVSEQVHEACVQCSREPSEVTIVGVSKYVGPELALGLVQAGCRILGENRPQSLWEKADYFSAYPGQETNWHMIGHLQRNKIRRTLPLIECLHSLDSLRLAEAVNHEAERAQVQLKTLVEVNVSQDESKTGLPTDQVCELLDRAGELRALKISGLMAMSTHQASSQAAQDEFASVRRLRDDLAARYPHLELSELSMGMSADFRAAIAEGATMVRIGSNLWEGLLSK